MSTGGAVSGEADGFAQFIEAREQALQRTAWLLTNDWALAQDLVQSALARSWPYWGRIRRGDDPEIYVRQVMVNTWATWRRRRWRAEEPSGMLTVRPVAGDVGVGDPPAQVTAQVVRLQVARRRVVAAVGVAAAIVVGALAASLSGRLGNPGPPV